MKMKNLKIAAALLACTALFAGCDLIESVGTTPTVTLTALSDSFDAQGEANISVVLSSYALEEVTVSLTATGDAAAAVTMDKIVKIGVGSKNQSLTVKVDLDQIKADTNVTISIQSAVGATVGSPKEVSIAAKANGGNTVEDPGVVSIEADDEFAADATANVTLKLSKALAEDVTVELEVLSADDYVTVPAEALAFTNPVVIKAGQTTESVKVTLNPELIPTGDNYALIGIKTVTGNASAAKDAEVLIVYVKEIVANLRNDWSVAYTGYNPEGYDAIDINVASDTQTYYLSIYYGGTIAANFESITEYLQWYESTQVAPYLGTEDAEVFSTGSRTAKFNRLDPETYEVYIIGCNADGHVNGDYTTVTFEIKPTDEMLAAVQAFLGDWVVNHYTWTIESAGGVYVLINGIEGETDYPVEAFVNWDGNLEIQNQPYIYESDTQIIGFYGLAGNSLWTSTGLTIAEVVLNADGESAVVNPATSPNGSAFESLAYLVYQNSTYYLWSNQIPLPATMERPAETVEETTPVKAGAYEDFLGTWKYADYELVVEAVEGVDTLYTVSGFPGTGYDPAYAVFSEGALVLSEQVTGSWSHSTYGQCVDLLNAVFSYNDKEFRAYAWNTGDPAVIFKAELHESGNLTLAPGTVTLTFSDGTSQDTPVVGLCYSWMIVEEGSDYYGRGNAEGTMYLDGKIAVTPVAAPAAAPKAVKKASRQFENGLSVNTVAAKKAVTTAKVSLKDRVIR